ncbi:MAG: GNAT family N-acetyltransferase [Gammaproteobacteria bacterium]|nr:GNAT family N-acetyltransferase [Gammaproteobacteria bacterium]
MLLTTERLLLTELNAGDAAFMLDLLNQPSFLHNIGDKGVRDRAQAEAFIENGPRRSYAERGFGLYKLVRKADGASMGLAGLVKRDSLEDVDLGYALLPRYWGGGYAREAAQAILGQARTLSLPRLAAIANADNAASERVLLALGFRGQGWHQLPGEAQPVRLYTLALA